MATTTVILSALDCADGHRRLPVDLRVYTRTALASTQVAFAKLCTADIEEDREGEVLWLVVAVLPEQRGRARHVLGAFLDHLLDLSIRQRLGGDPKPSTRELRVGGPEPL